MSFVEYCFLISFALSLFRRLGAHLSQPEPTGEEHCWQQDDWSSDIPTLPNTQHCWSSSDTSHHIQQSAVANKHLAVLGKISGGVYQYLHDMVKID